MGRFIGVLFVILVALLGASFAVLNAQPVPINFYLGIRQVPLALIVVIAMAAGAALGVIASLFKVFKLNRETQRLRRQVRAVEREVVNLRPISMEDAN